MRLILITLSFLFFLEFPAHANEISGADISKKIYSFLDKNGVLSKPAIDGNRKFPKCPSKLSIKSMFNSWKTVKVSCPETDWKIVVRTNANQHFSSPKNRTIENFHNKKFVVKLTKSLNKGELLKPEDLAYELIIKNTGSGIFYDKSVLYGRRLKTPLSSGTIVHARHLTPDWVIIKNQEVIIEHQIGNILINTKGIAQESGQIGEKILVSNISSGKKILCWIKNDKKVSTNSKIY